MQEEQHSIQQGNFCQKLLIYIECDPEQMTKPKTE